MITDIKAILDDYISDELKLHRMRSMLQLDDEVVIEQGQHKEALETLCHILSELGQCPETGPAPYCGINDDCEKCWKRSLKLSPLPKQSFDLAK